MNSNMAVDGDPLSTYGYPLYGVYEPPVNPNPYPYDVKLENTPSNPYNTQVTKEQEIQQSYKLENNDGVKSYIPTYTPNDSVEKIINSVINENEQCPNSNEDIKPDIKDLKPKRGRKNKTGRRSSYFAEKIKEVGFPFYGCAVCDISFPALHELDQHVTTHKGRVTSYHLRVKNRLKRKMLKKQQKKLQKAKSVKKEFEVEIKPEDGYIGSQTTESYRSNCNENGTDVPNKNSKNAKEIEKSGNASDDGVNQNLEKIYKCFACKKQFQLSYYLKLHVRSHTDEKPYQCPECGESFITASKLGRHNKRVHLSIKYQCRICFKMFARFENLTRHFDKTHPEDKLEGEPYDYNAILPYLKEMEQELREKAEAEETRKQMKSEGFWPEDWLCATETKDEMKEEKTEDKDRPPESQVAVVEVKIPEIEPEIVVTVENEDSQEDHGPDLNDEPVSCDRIKEEGLKNEEESDDDYFPDNTWTEQPKMDAEPSSPQTKKRTPKNTGSKQCEICQKEVSSSSYMKVHMRTHTGERPFKCYICKRGFITASKMHRHAMTHEESWLEEDNKPVKTEITDVKVEIEITREDEDKKKSETIISYQKAKDRFYKKIKRNQDKKPVDRSRPKKRPHPCEFCQKRFLHLETLNIHKKSHEGEDAVRQCYYCLLKMDNDEALKTHEATHTGPKPYFCTLCGKSYKKRETMVYHRKNHKQEKKFICDICSKPFNAPCKLQRHIVSHRASKFILRYECPVCAHMFNTKYHIRMHLTTHQKEGLIMEENRNEVLAMVLQNARRIPRSPDAPANLSDLIPADERSRVCNICGAVFQHFYYLEEHLKSHGSKIAIEDDPAKEEKKYICPVCHKGFKLHYYLKLHSFTHTKEKPFICQQCGKGFITKGKLKRHLETHAGLKKYQCHICYKFFTRPSYLRIHVRTIHGTQDSYRSVLLDRQ